MEQQSFLGGSGDRTSISRKPIATTSHRNVSQSSSFTVVDSQADPKYNAVPATEALTYEPSHISAHAKRYNILRWWKWELVASFVSISSTIALIAVLRNYDKVPVAELNLPPTLQLNAIVAALSTVIRVAFMVPVTTAIVQDNWLWFSSWGSGSGGRKIRSRFEDLELADEASRGVMGSFWFLFKGGRRYFAYVGALVTILSLAFATFTQQLVSNEVLPINKGVPSLQNFPRSRTWSYQQGLMDAVTNYLNPSIKAAINLGVFEPNVQPLTVSCPTGNCTWPTTPSLAICGECSPSPVVETCEAAVTTEDSYMDSICNYTVPSGNLFQNGSAHLFSSLSQPKYGHARYNASDPTRAYLANFDMGGVANSDPNWLEWNKTTVQAWECALWACVQSYDVNVQSQSQTTTVTQTWSDVTGIQNSTNGYLLNKTWGNPTNTSDTRNETQYSMAEIAGAMLSQYLGPFFEGNVSSYVTRGGEAYSNDYIQVIYKAAVAQNSTDGPDAFVKNIALSMSNVFRTAEPSQNDLYNGVASTLSISVRWQWLALPLLLVSASLIFSLINIVRTARSDVGAWKGGPLALLFCDVESQTRLKAAGAMERPQGLKSAIGKTKAVLLQDERGGWTFKSA